MQNQSVVWKLLNAWYNRLVKTTGFTKKTRIPTLLIRICLCLSSLQMPSSADI
jgi:hypothetical protein